MGFRSVPKAIKFWLVLSPLTRVLCGREMRLRVKPDKESLNLGAWWPLGAMVSYLLMQWHLWRSKPQRNLRTIALPGLLELGFYNCSSGVLPAKPWGWACESIPDHLNAAQTHKDSNNIFLVWHILITLFIILALGLTPDFVISITSGWN